MVFYFQNGRYFLCRVRFSVSNVPGKPGSNTSAASGQVRVGCADRVSRKEAKTQRRQGCRSFVLGFCFMTFCLVFPLHLGVLSDSGRENWSGGIHEKIFRGEASLLQS